MKKLLIYTKAIIVISLMFYTNISYTQALSKKSYNDESNFFGKNTYIQLGALYGTFQDTRYSNLQYGGAGLNFDIGFNTKNAKRYWEIGLSLNANFENPATFSSSSVTVLHPYLYFKYLKSLNNNLRIGARLDLADFYLRQIKGLGNNGNYIITGHNLYGSAMYDIKLSNKWNLQTTLDLGLVSFMRESTGFAFSAPQKGLEEGEFSYQNETLSSPTGYKYFEWMYLGNYLNLKTSFMFQFKKRISLGYAWSSRHFSTVKSYPVTTGMHTIIFRYNIIHK